MGTMTVFILGVLILAMSFVLAKRSMKDFDTKRYVKKSGRIVFYKHGTKHYSSSLSSSASRAKLKKSLSS
jgi:hypothetical protein